MFPSIFFLGLFYSVCRLVCHSSVLFVRFANLRTIIDRLLMRCAAAGLLLYYDRMAEFVCRLSEGRSAGADGADADDEDEETSSRLQWLDLKWLWAVYAMGNALAMCVFAVGVLVRWFKTRV